MDDDHPHFVIRRLDRRIHLYACTERQLNGMSLTAEWTRRSSRRVTMGEVRWTTN